jgi:hypothetical protein
MDMNVYALEWQVRARLAEARAASARAALAASVGSSGSGALRRLATVLAQAARGVRGPAPRDARRRLPVS